MKLRKNNLKTRILDYELLKSRPHPGQGQMQTRINNGGYHRPGSNKK